jgi:hypothetical protein
MDIVGLKGLFRWLRQDRGFRRSAEAAGPGYVKTSYASTVFTGESTEWVRYLDSSRHQRYDPSVRIDILLNPPTVDFVGHGELSSELVRYLRRALAGLHQSLRPKPFVWDRFEQLVFRNPGNQQGKLTVRVSPTLPCEASREIALGGADNESGATIVLRNSLVETVLKNVRHAGGDITDREHLGLCWPLLRRVISQLGYPNNPRDRFVEKIDLTVDSCLLAINVLYDGKRGERLVPNAVGELYERYVARRDGMRRNELFDRHPYFRLMNELSFMFDESSFRAHTALAQVLVREYLDGRYLRLSLAGIMPEVDDIMAPMPYHWEKHKVSTTYPRLRRYGILDEEDLSAWKKVEGPFRDMGFTLIRQLGIGQFGRVYEACNQFNPHLPRHVAIKIDRIVRGKKKEAIQNAEATMRIGEDLSAAPHVIRVFDAGKLKGKRYTYHLLQVVDGDTLDNLVGISGIEHSSVLRPRRGTRSEREVQQDYLKAVKASTREIWRRQRMTRPFLDPLSLSQTLDLLTSILLWLEEIHQLNYAVNDLKNGNLMISRRGQLKGIDLDAYSLISDPMDRATDFFFLAVSLLLLLLNIKKARDEPMIGCEGLMRSRDTLREALSGSWPFADVAQLSDGRVVTAQTIELLVDLIQRSRDHSYALAPDLFTADIDRLITLKRAIFGTEIVLD